MQAESERARPRSGVEMHARPHAKGGGALLGRPLGEDRAGRDFAGKGLLNRLAKAAHARGIAERVAVRILHGENIEREAVALTLKLTNGNQAAAARLLGISRPTLAKKMPRPAMSERAS